MCATQRPTHHNRHRYSPILPKLVQDAWTQLHRLPFFFFFCSSHTASIDRSGHGRKATREKGRGLSQDTRTRHTKLWYHTRINSYLHIRDSVRSPGPRLKRTRTVTNILRSICYNMIKHLKQILNIYISGAFKNSSIETRFYNLKTGTAGWKAAVRRHATLRWRGFVVTLRLWRSTWKSRKIKQSQSIKKKSRELHALILGFLVRPFLMEAK